MKWVPSKSNWYSDPSWKMMSVTSPMGPKATPAELALRSGFPEGFVEDWLSGLGAEGYVLREGDGRYRLAQPRW